MTLLNEVAEIFQKKLAAERSGPFGRLPMRPPGHKDTQDTPKVNKADIPNIDYHKLKEIILYSCDLPSKKAHQLQKNIETLDEISKKLVQVGVKLAYKIEEVGDKGYQNTTASEEELKPLLSEFKKLLEGLDRLGDNIIYYASPNLDGEFAKLIASIDTDVNNFAKRI